MSIVGPVTMSVANTVKRGLLISVSVYVFQNPVSLVNWLGILLILVGVMLYSWIRHHEKGVGEASSETNLTGGPREAKVHPGQDGAVERAAGALPSAPARLAFRRSTGSSTSAPVGVTGGDGSPSTTSLGLYLPV